MCVHNLTIFVFEVHNEKAFRPLQSYAKPTFATSDQLHFARLCFVDAKNIAFEYEVVCNMILLIKIETFFRAVSSVTWQDPEEESRRKQRKNTFEVFCKLQIFDA